MLEPVDHFRRWRFDTRSRIGESAYNIEGGGGLSWSFQNVRSLLCLH